MRQKFLRVYPIDTNHHCTLSMAAIRLGVPAAEAEAMLKKHSVPFVCYHFRKYRTDWTEEEAEDFAYAEIYLGLTEADYPFESVRLFSGKAIRQLSMFGYWTSKTLNIFAESK